MRNFKFVNDCQDIVYASLDYANINLLDEMDAIQNWAKNLTEDYTLKFSLDGNSIYCISNDENAYYWIENDCTNQMIYIHKKIEVSRIVEICEK